MTLKNARIYQELMRRLSPTEEATLRPHYSGNGSNTGMREDRVRTGLARQSQIRAANGFRRVWNGQN